MTRPRKLVLLHCVDEQRRSLLTFLLEVNHYDVVAKFSPRPPLPHLALIVHDPTSRAAAYAVFEFGDISILVLRQTRSQQASYPLGIMVQFMDANAKPHQLLSRIKLMAGRKRGQRKRPEFAMEEAISA